MQKVERSMIHQELTWFLNIGLNIFEVENKVKNY